MLIVKNNKKVAHFAPDITTSIHYNDRSSYLFCLVRFLLQLASSRICDISHRGIFYE